MEHGEPYTNERGNKVTGQFFMERDRYHYDFDACTPADGWAQWDTDQDAWYFGVWIHIEDRKILTWAEGDESLVECPTQEAFIAELKCMTEFHGNAPPSFKTIDLDGTLTHHFCPRPGEELLK